ncbi:hypothetical protein Tcan_09882 [Toxocara canis]|uniref:Uncharacterized protein n=1 Tax=Toxocara canis TaxID=6265 RepID=A0A0B2VAJ6_TOXCA|nr:hypothetical protein Tcan_09882 [Toxocara canis]
MWDVIPLQARGTVRHAKASMSLSKESVDDKCERVEPRSHLTYLEPFGCWQSMDCIAACRMSLNETHSCDCKDSNARGADRGANRSLVEAQVAQL